MSLTRWVRRAGARRRAVLPCLLFALAAVSAGQASAPHSRDSQTNARQTHARPVAQTHARA